MAAAATYPYPIRSLRAVDPERVPLALANLDLNKEILRHQEIDHENLRHAKGVVKGLEAAMSEI